MIAFELLADWALDALDAGEQDRVEEHLMTCSDCALVAARLVEMRDGVASLARAGMIRHTTTRTLLARMKADQLELRHYVVAPGEKVDCRATAEQAYAITEMSAGLDDIVRVDLEVAVEGGPVIAAVEDVPFDAASGAVFAAEAGDAIRALPSVVLRITLRGTDAEGGARPIGTYHLHHTGLG